MALLSIHRTGHVIHEEWILEPCLPTEFKALLTYDWAVFEDCCLVALLSTAKVFGQLLLPFALLFGTKLGKEGGGGG